MRVFLSYRRDDTAGRAGRIADVFTARYGARNVFQDVDAASPGLDFAERVDAAIVDSDVMLVVIGRGWLSSAGADGGRRIDRPDDFVRREVSAALTAGSASCRCWSMGPSYLPAISFRTSWPGCCAGRR